GTVAPKVSTAPVSFSGGGTTPLARTTLDGAESGLDWAGPLPAPVLDGATATYRDVLPGVDLALRATGTGFTQSVVVRDAAAARNPALRELRFGLHGAAPTTDSSAAIRTGDRAGRSEVAANASATWDVGEHDITLRADVAALADAPDTAYPLSTTGSDWGRRQHWMLLSHNTSTGAKAAYWDSAQYIPRIGRVPGDPLRWRSYFEMDTARLIGKNVSDAQFRIYEWWSESCTPSPIELWHIGAISPSTTWDSAPLLRKVSEIYSAKGFDASCQRGSIELDITDLMTQAAYGRWERTTVALKGRENADSYGGKEFLDRDALDIGLENAVLSITAHYNTVPYRAKNLVVDGVPCGDEPVVVKSPAPVLEATLTDADTELSQRVRGVFRWWEDTGGAPPAEVSSAASEYSVVGPAGIGAKAKVPDTKPLREGVTYVFGVTVDDTIDANDGLPHCRFVVDRTRPKTSAVTVSSAEFPRYPAPGPLIYTKGQFTISANGDPDVVGFRYAIGGLSTTPTIPLAADAPGGTATVSYTADTATGWATERYLAVTTVDRAKQESSTTYRYQFNVTPVVTSSTVYAEWLADSVTGGVLQDKATTPGYPATISGRITSTKNRKNSSTGAVRLDGVSSYAATSVPIAPRTEQNTFGSFTAMAWVKLDKAEDWATALSQDGAVNSGFALKYNHGTRTWQFSMERYDTDQGRSMVAADSNTWAQVGAWVHLAGVYDHAAGRLYLYVNGRLAGQADYTSTWYAAGPTALGRARYNGALDDFWPGDLDELKVYPWAASQVEVTSRMGETFASQGTWSFDEGSGQVVADVAAKPGSGHTLALHQGASWASPGRSGTSALRLDGVTGHAYTAGPVAPRSTEGTFDSFTVMSWVKLNQLDNWKWAVSQDGKRDSGFVLGYSSYPRGWSFGMSGADEDGNGGGGFLIGDPYPQTGVWTHLAGVYDHAAGTITLYVNGRAVKSMPHRSTWYAEGAVQVGRAKNDGWLVDHWPGEIDDVQLLTGARSEAEIRTAMAGPTFAAGARWALENNGTDATGNGHALALWPGASWTGGKVGSGLRFDGGEGHAFSALPVLETNKSFTAAGWVKLDSVDGSQTVVGQEGALNGGFRLHYDHAAKAWAFTIAGDTRTGGTVPDGVVRGTATPRSGEWTHLAGVYDEPAREMRIFVNGRLQAKASYLGVAHVDQRVTIGSTRRDGFLADLLVGSVDEVELRPSATGPEEVFRMSGMRVPSFGTADHPAKIEDLATVDSGVLVFGLTPDMVSTLEVDVDITHTYVGDLVLRLVAPDNTEYLLEDLTAGGDVDNFKKTYRLNASAELVNGTWKLRVQDKAIGDTGTVVNWVIRAPVTDAAAVSAPWSKVGGTSFTVANNTKTERSVTVSGVPGNAPSNLTVAIDKTSSSGYDLKVWLVAPDKKEFLLHDGAEPPPPSTVDACGNPTYPSYDLKKSYVVNAMTSPANGVWTLRIVHSSSSGAPTITAWSLSSSINLVASSTAPATKFANATDVPLDGYATYSSVTACGIPGAAANDVRVAVDVRHPNRGDLKLELTAPGYAANYVLEDVPDNDTGEDVRKTYTIPGVAQLPNGSWELRVIDTKDQYAGLINEWSVQILPSAQATVSADWKAENTADVPIADDGWTESPVTVAGLTGMAPKVWRVSVDIKHTHRGDLALYLEAPDGTGYLLEDVTGANDVDDLAKSYTVNASAEIANGTWKLKVLDAVWGDVGFIDSWSLSAPDFTSVTTDVRAPVADLATVDSPLTVTGAANRTVANGTQVKATVTHAKPEQLVITLVAPDGTTYPLHDRKPVLPTLFRLDAAGEAVNGTWKLRVQDTASGEVGAIESWGLVLAPAVAWPEARGTAFTVDGTTAVTSTVRVAGIAGNAPADLRLSVATTYAWPSELKIALIAPDGTSYPVHDGAATMPGTFVVDASAEPANGVWKLSVQRNSTCCAVPITSWSLWSPANQQATPSGPVTKFANGNDVAITDDGYAVLSTAYVSGITGTGAKDLRVVVDIKHPNRGDLKLDLWAPGEAASYRLEDVPDSDTGDDLFKTYTLPGVAQLVNGDWDLVVTDTKTGNTGRIDGWSIQVLATPQVALPAGWRVENGTDTSIQDYAAVESPITVSGLGGAAPKAWDVSVALKHTYRGDLVLHLVAPDGTAYLLEDFAGSGDADDLTKTYTVNASSELADGVWKLRVRDRVWGDVGHLDSWSLAAAPTGTPEPAVAWPEVRGSAFTVDGSTTSVTGSSTVRVAGIAGNAPSDLRLTVGTSYAWPSELKIALIAPDGTSYTVHDRTSPLPGTFVVDASAEVANGVWKLWVQRNSTCCAVPITSWSLWSPVNRQATPSGPVTKFVNGNDVAITDDGYAVESGVQVAGIPGNAPADLRVSVDLKHPNRGDLKLDLVAPDGTRYPLEDIPDSDTGDNVVKSYVVNGSAETANGAWRLRVTDTVTGNAGTIDGWSLYLSGLLAVAPGTRFENTADVPTADNGTVESTVSIAGITGAAPSGLRVGVVIRHPQRGDLKLDLVAPDGTVYPLEDLTGSGNGDDVVTEYAVNASAELANGTWRLRVADSVLGDVGVVDSWSLTFPAPSKYHNPGNVTIADNGAAAVSVIAVAGRTGAAPADLRVVVDVKHPNRGDLVLDLVAPDGTAYRLEDVPDGDTGDNVQATYWVNASAEAADGGWGLRVRDAVTGNSGGLIDAWSLQFGPE
ncbi:MAG: DNRLRE domain-containing protein, partial [Saccharothrix sp.]|nr:DNRLRE domain-containing protein [Saccharothrix sp.]